MLALLGFSLLLLEICLTRLFSYLFPYHFTQLALSLALLGLGLGAWVRGARGPVRRSAAWALLAASLGAALLCSAVSGSPVLIVAAWLAPFFFHGLLMAQEYADWGGARASRACALDLAGGAAACLLATPALESAGATKAVLALAAAAVGAALWPRSKALALAAAAAAAAAAIPLDASLSSALAASPMMRVKSLGRYLQGGGALVGSRWSAVGRADLYEREGSPVRWIFNDGISPTLLPAKDFRQREAVLRLLLNYVPYELVRPREALVLGSGSGLEVELARLAGAERVAAVEINPAAIALVRASEDYAGPIYRAAGVELLVEEGRRFLARDPRRYDLIQMSFVLTGNQQPASFALVEGYLYTVEAFSLYLDRLKPGGALAVIDESRERILRQVLTALEAHRERGISFDEALQRIAVVSIKKPDEEFWKFLLFISSERLSEKQIEKLSAFRGELVPNGPSEPPFSALASLGPAEFLRIYPLDMTPCRDDSPHFFSYAKGLSQRLLLASPWWALLTAVLALGAWAGRGAPAGGGAAFASGLCFLFAELALLRFLALHAGGPTRTLAVLLFSLLAWGAAGAWAGGRLSLPLSGRYLACAAAVPLSGFLAGKVGLWAGLVPAGLALGLPMPELLRRAASAPPQAARLWGLSGLGSVAGAALSLGLVLLAGARAQLALAGILYLALAALVRGFPGPSGPSAGRPRP